MSRVLVAIDPATMHGLEIGPLANPAVRPSEGSIKYLDHASTEELRAKYRGNDTLRPLIDQLVEVDYVADGQAPLSEAVSQDAPFDYVIAAHVIEHIPNLVGWFLDVAEILRLDGILSLVIPDKRFSFDVNRSVTEVSELIDAYLRGLKEPSIKQMYDFFSMVTTIDGSVDTEGIWAGTADYKGATRSDVPDAHVAAYQTCVQQLRDRNYVDVHCHVFTPSSFLDLFDILTRLDLMPYEIESFTPTASNQLEFHVSLKKITNAPDEAGREQQRRRTRELIRQLKDSPSPSLDWDVRHSSGYTLKSQEREEPPSGKLSVREAQLIELKRSMLWTLRRGYGKIRHQN